MFDDDNVVASLMFVITCCVITAIFIHTLAYGKARNDAVEAGVAEYYLDENNDKQFRYLEPVE